MWLEFAKGRMNMSSRRTFEADERVHSFLLTQLSEYAQGVSK